jgi:hypothetical protein
MGKGRRYYTYTPVVHSAPPIQQPTTFSPPLAMQQSVWDSIVNGNFIDAKIFAFSRRSHEPGRVDTPKALFINTHVLATACSYFRTSTPLPLFRGFRLIIPVAFEFSDGIATSLEAELPQGEEPFFQMEEHDSDIDYDGPVEAPVECGPAEVQPPIGTAAPILPERTVKAYVVKYTAYRTFVVHLSSLGCLLIVKCSLRAIIWYIYSGEINFSPHDSPESPSASAKSVYRFADEVRIALTHSHSLSKVTVAQDG